jgi:hypothetical protein
MSMAKTNVTAPLDRLTLSLKECAHAYAGMSDKTPDLLVSATLSALYSSRIVMLADVERELAKRNKSPKGLRDRVTGSLRRKWDGFRAALAAAGQGNILAECERGECSVLEEYDHLPAMELFPNSVGEMLLRHREMLRSNLDDIRFLSQARSAQA